MGRGRRGGEDQAGGNLKVIDAGVRARVGESGQHLLRFHTQGDREYVKKYRGQGVDVDVALSLEEGCTL